MPRTLITEEMVVKASRDGLKSIEVPPGSILTPLSQERALQLGISLVPPKEQEPQTPKDLPQKASQSGDRGVVVFGSDHGGFQLKEQLKVYATTLGYPVADVGTMSEESCDYPDYAYAVALSVSTGNAWRGVMIDGAGIGSCVVANKVPRVRAACCHNEFVARNAREHNDTNVLTLGSRVTGIEVCKEILRIWLESWFSGGRHKQRVDKIEDVEKRYLK